MNSKMKNIGLLLCFVGILFSCDPKQDWLDTGISSPYHDGSIMEYLRGDTANWKLTVVLVERAGLTDLIDGKDPVYPEITFFAPSSLSVLRYVWDKATGREEFPHDPDRWRELTDEEGAHPEKLVQALDPAWCREMVMRHVVKGKHLKATVAFRNRAYDIEAEEQDGGTDWVCESGNRVRAYLEKSNYGGVADAGAVTMSLYSFDAWKMVPLATPDIQPTNGVVHALNYNYVLGEI